MKEQLCLSAPLDPACQVLDANWLAKECSSKRRDQLQDPIVNGTIICVIFDEEGFAWE